MRPRLVVIVVVSLVALGVVSPATAVTAPSSAKSPAIDKAALGSGGGKFCDDARKNIADAFGANLGGILSDPVKLKVYFDKQKKATASLINGAPAEIKPSLLVSKKLSDAVADGLKKANYVFSKIDPAVLAKVSQPDAATKAANAKVQGYFVNTCHIDVNKALSGTVSH